MDAWENFLQAQQKQLGPETVAKWLRTLKIVSYDACNLYLEAQDAFQANWFEEYIRPNIHTLVNNNYHRIKVHLSVAQDQQKEKKDKKKSAPVSSFRLDLSPNSLDPKATFESFVPSSSNPLPYKLLSELIGFCPDKKTYEEPKIELGSFNPLFIYGPAGSGKSHLLMAIANHFQNKGRKIFYVHTEKFTEHVVQAIRNGAMQEFRKAYRHVDILLVDDVHLLARRSSTQEELFHTFNALHTSGKQIILCASSPPSLLTEIEPRLISRFEWGLLLPLEKLSVDELKKVIKNRSIALDFPLSEEVLNYLMNTFQRSAKSLHKAFEALVLRMDKKRGVLNEKLVEGLLTDLIKEEQEIALDPEKIIRAVAEFYGIRSEDILGKSQTQDCALPRQVAMFFCRTHLKLPFIKIGTIFSRDHSTVMSSVKQIQTKIESQDKEFSSSYSSILRKLENPD